MREPSTKSRLIAAGALFLLAGWQAVLSPCTVAVVSGRATPDGRPLLWKNRDTSNSDNKVVFIRGRVYAFLAVVSSNDSEAAAIWQGLNQKGFAVMNSMSGDLAANPGGAAENGIFMRKALESCADVDEFEALLKATNGRRKVASNFGVIDANGRARFYETGSDSFTRFDADDPRVAPEGYIVRTNFAFTAPVAHKGGGYIRFERVSHLFERAAAEGRLDHRFILREVARDLVNEKLHSFPLAHPESRDPARPLYVRTNDTLSRASTVSVSVFHGAPGPDRPDLATMWTLLGQPVCGVALPLWVGAESVPDVLTGEETAPFCDMAKAVETWLYPDQRTNMRQYLSVTRLLGYQGEGILARLFAAEDRAFDETRVILRQWEAAAASKEAAAEFQNRIADRAYLELKQAFAPILDR